MMPWAALNGAILLILQLTALVSAQPGYESSAQRGEDAKESISCSGALPNLLRWRRSWPEVDQIENLAQFCVKASYPFAGALCGWQLDEPTVIFDLEHVSGLRTRDRFPSAVIEFCYIKCRCTATEVDTPKPEVKFYRPGGYLHALYDFDLYSFDFGSEELPEDSRVHDPSFRLGQQITPFANSLSNRGKETYPIFLVDRRHLPFPPQPDFFIRRVSLVGGEKNAPACRAGLLSRAIRNDLARFGLEQIKDFTSLCLHRFYKGSQIANMGGVCLNIVQIGSQLTFMPSLRSPRLMYDPVAVDMVDQIVLDGLEAMCMGACWCSPEERLRKDVAILRVSNEARPDRSEKKHVTFAEGFVTSPRVNILRPLELGGGARSSSGQGSSNDITVSAYAAWRRRVRESQARCGAPCSRYVECSEPCSCQAHRASMPDDPIPRMKAFCQPNGKPGLWWPGRDEL